MKRRRSPSSSSWRGDPCKKGVGSAPTLASASGPEVPPRPRRAIASSRRPRGASHQVVAAIALACCVLCPPSTHRGGGGGGGFRADPVDPRPRPALLPCQALPLAARGRRNRRRLRFCGPRGNCNADADADTALRAAKRGGGGKSRSGAPSAAGIKGFGSAPSSSGARTSAGSAAAASAGIRIDRSSRVVRFYEYLGRSGAGGANLRRTALATAAGGLRGVVATRDVAKGDDILCIPYEAAVNLGRQGDDPTVPAWAFLQDYTAAMAASSSSPSSSGRKAYYDMLPALGSSQDYLTSTDFFSSDALRELQSPLIVEETLRRRERVRRHWEESVATAGAGKRPSGGAEGAVIDPSQGGAPTLSQLQWAVWLVTSRVLTVQGSSPSEQFRLLIPYLDMCNHDRSSPHVLTGRAAPGGMLRVVAGRNVKAGEFVEICYGGGVTGQDRFIQDYGFLDASPDAYRIVARQLTGEARVPAEGASGGRFLSQVDCDRSLEALGATSVEQDEAELRSLNDSAPASPVANLDVRTAIQYRIGVKTALAALS